MATRSQVLFYEEDYENPIVFYQHWDGYELPYIVADALDRAKKDGRLTDTAYLGRIIFSEMLRHSNTQDKDWHEALSSDTGYGISRSEQGWIEFTVKVYSSYENEPKIEVVTVNDKYSYSFNEFINNYLKADGAFGWKSHSKEKTNV